MIACTRKTMNSQWEKNMKILLKLPTRSQRWCRGKKTKELNGMWGEFGPVPTHASSSWARTSFCAQSLAPVKEDDTDRVGSGLPRILPWNARPDHLDRCLRAGGRGGSSIFSNLRFRVFEQLEQTTVINPTNWPDTRGGLVNWYRFH